MAQRDDHFLHLAQTPAQILAARSDFYVDKSGGFVSSMNKASQLPVDNNTLGPHYMSKSHSFADKAGNVISAVFGGFCFSLGLCLIANVRLAENYAIL